MLMIRISENGFYVIMLPLLADTTLDTAKLAVTIGITIAFKLYRLLIRTTGNCASIK